MAMTRPHSTLLPAIAAAVLLGACNANLSAPQATSPQYSAKPATRRGQRTHRQTSAEE